MKKLKLSELTKNSLSQKGLKNVIGGTCSCACAYEGTPNGSTTDQNGTANANGGKRSPGTGPRVDFPEADVACDFGIWSW